MRDYYRKAPSPWWRRGAIILLTLVGIFAAWQLISYGVQLGRNRSLRHELKAETWHDVEEAPAAVTEPSGTPEVGEAPAPTPGSPSVGMAARLTTPTGRPEIRLSLAGLWERNNDLVGWLTVEALPQLDIPIVQRDNSYYMRRDFDGRNNINGTAFMDVNCSIWPRSDNLIIYAHNMKSGEMFGGLQKLRQEIFWRTSPMSSFSTLYDKADYVPVAVVLCDLAQGERHFNFTQTDFADEAGFDAFIARARQLSDVHPPYDVRHGDDLLTLVTCHGETDTQRLVVILRRVREDEDRDVLAQMWE